MSRAEYLSCLAMAAVMLLMCVALFAFFIVEGAPWVFRVVPVVLTVAFVICGVEVYRGRQTWRRAGR